MSFFLLFFGFFLWLTPTIFITLTWSMHLLALINKSARVVGWSRAKDSYSGTNVIPWSIIIVTTLVYRSYTSNVAFLKWSTYCLWVSLLPYQILSRYVQSFFLWLLIIKVLMNFSLNWSKVEIDLSTRPLYQARAWFFKVKGKARHMIASSHPWSNIRDSSSECDH